MAQDGRSGARTGLAPSGLAKSALEPAARVEGADSHSLRGAPTSLATRRALLRRLSGLPEGPILDQVGALDWPATGELVGLLLWGAAALCETEATRVTWADLMRALARRGAAR